MSYSARLADQGAGANGHHGYLQVMAPSRFFNDAGPIRPDRHYCVPPLERIDLLEVCALIDEERYFVLHAPRQTGKTTILLALRDLLNGGAVGDYRCVYANVEAAQAMRENVAQAMRSVLGEMTRRARLTLGDDLLGRIWPAAMESSGPGGVLTETLSRWFVDRCETSRTVH